ncbi:MAG: hypothetical protein JSU94_14040 [Phycisphaerales bacterium]|nr:MAG: hypothetical protein JSU94_14040 [Phycisphaerales bacterium]
MQTETPTPWLRRICPRTGLQVITLAEFGLWAVIVISLITVPPYLVSRFPANWNALSQVLFQIVTALLSGLIGYRLTKAASEQHITRKWLPGAQTACNQIQVMQAQVYRLRKTRRTTCDELQDLISGLNESERRTIEKVVRIKCEGCKARLLDIQDHLATAYETWRVFVRENCDRIVECDEIEHRLSSFAKSLRHEEEEAPSQEYGDRQL